MATNKIMLITKKQYGRIPIGLRIPLLLIELFREKAVVVLFKYSSEQVTEIAICSIVSASHHNPMDTVSSWHDRFSIDRRNKIGCKEYTGLNFKSLLVTAQLILDTQMN